MTILAIESHQDITELDLPSTMKTHFPNPADLLNFTLTITPDEGITLLFKRITISPGSLRDVLGRRLSFLLCHQLQLPSRASKSQVHSEGEHANPRVIFGDSFFPVRFTIQT